MGMETRVGQVLLTKRSAEDSAGFGQDTSFIAEDELLSALEELRLGVEPFVLASWVREEAEALGRTVRTPGTFPQNAESSPRMLLCVLAYSYAVGLFSSEEIVRNCRTNGALAGLCGGKFLFRQELRYFRRRHRALLTDLIARIFMRFVCNWFALNRQELPQYMKRSLQRTAIERLDIARHLDSSDE